MSNSIPTQLRFPPFAGFTVRADFEGGALSSDFGPLLLRGVDQQIGLIHRLSQAINDRRHASYIDHSLGDLLTQRIFQIACGYADANDANTLRRDPMFKLGAERKPLETEQDLASAPGKWNGLPENGRALGNKWNPQLVQGLVGVIARIVMQ